MAVPKRRTSRANTRMRRSQWKISAPDLVPITLAGVQYRIPRRLVRAVKLGLLNIDELGL